MYSAPRSIRAVSMFFVSCFSGTVALSQSVNFIRHVAGPLPIAKLAPSRAPCARDSNSSISPSHAASGVTGKLDAPCDAQPVNLIPVNPSPVNPCNFAGAAQTGCNSNRDLVRENLAALGKEGQKILRARERVLEILQNENACSAWYREKDANPAATFRTLSFEVDGKGEDFISEFREPDSLRIFHDPYIARVGQDAGAYTAITLNENGAFFRSAARVVEAGGEGGPFTMLDSRRTNVGLYPGGSLSAQVLALLHEFGHIVNLLPMDFHDVDGKSVQNTQEVLRYCRSEIESKSKKNTLIAAH
jgi:hypothetical protein